MQPLELALKYMEIFFAGQEMDELRPLLTNDFTFKGPFYQFKSSEDYINALKLDPPQHCEYKIINALANEASVCLIYQFIKPGICEPMAQFFEIKEGQINHILLIFDTKAFVQN